MSNAKPITPTNKTEYLELLTECLSEIDKLNQIIDENSLFCEQMAKQAA